MNWLKDNPLGMALVATSGVLALLALVMGIVWTLPEAEVVAAESAQETADGKTDVIARQAAPVSEFEVINERPVFNESRLPEVEPEDGGDEPPEEITVAVKDAPDVRLTGVIITPSMKIASLTPADTNLESVMAHEGQVLEGEFVGWQVSSVGPRKVVLESRDGQKLDLELQVHDAAIKQPPKPKKPAPDKSAQTASAQGNQMVDEDGEPLSRAEQIRMRIAERREELRREQEIQQAKKGIQAQSQALGSKTANTAKPKDYQSAIRAMMNKGRNSDKNEDEDG